jgi:hypothetical protein
MRLIPGVLVAPFLIAEIDSNRDGILSAAEKQAYAERVLGDLSMTVDGRSIQPKLISWSFPLPAQMRDGVGEIQIEYAADLPHGAPNRTLILANHHLNRTSVYLMNVAVPQDRLIRLLAQKRNEQQSFYELHYQQTAATDAGPRAAESDGRGFLQGDQFLSLFDLGMRHIAQGIDHILFLLTLLLPAPLLVLGSRWGPPARMRHCLLRILGIVTAFTIGHSITLSIAAWGVVRVPERPVEALIAASIFVSAAHALRPIFPGREAWIAGCFGLIHGLAFAATLARLGLERWERVAGILAFNLGIETMQILVVVLTLPSLLLVSRTRAYPIVRIGGAVFAGAAAVGWMIERLSDVETPVEMIVHAVARHGLFIAITGVLVGLACRFLPVSAEQATKHGLAQFAK